jgi:hypothetical protein
MPSPSTSLATQRPDLSGSFLEFDLEMQKRGYIASRVLPVMEVAKQAGTFGKIPIEQLLEQRSTVRAPGSGYSRGKFTFTTASYSCIENGAEEPIDDREAKMYAEYFDAEQVAAARSMEVVLRNAELRVAAAVFNATTWTSNTTGITHEWDDAANAVPITDVETATQAVWTACGMWPNALIINRKVFRNIRNCDSVLARMKYQGFVDVRAGAINEATLATLFDLDQVIVAGAATNSALEGQAASIAPTWSDEYAMVCKVATTNDIREPAVGRTMHWNEDGSAYDGRLESYRDESVRSDIVRARHDVDEIITYVEAGHLLSNVTT